MCLRKRRYVKLHLVADKKTKKIVGFRVTGGHTADTKKFVPMVKEVSKKRRVAKAYADTAYDSRRNFNLLRKERIEPAQAKERCHNEVSRLSIEEGGGRPREEAGVRGMDAAEGLREEVDRLGGAGGNVQRSEPSEEIE